jgi:hypothetical protein
LSFSWNFVKLGSGLIGTNLFSAGTFKAGSVVKTFFSIGLARLTTLFSLIIGGLAGVVKDFSFNSVAFTWIGNFLKWVDSGFYTSNKNSESFDCLF